MAPVSSQPQPGCIGRPRDGGGELRGDIGKAPLSGAAYRLQLRGDGAMPT
jgi:hypothetical protein